jgi:hypothetical protein
MSSGIQIVKNDENHDELNFKYEKKLLEKFQCIIQLNYSFYGGLFFYFNFNITMTFF